MLLPIMPACSASVSFRSLLVKPICLRRSVVSPYSSYIFLLTLPNSSAPLLMLPPNPARKVEFLPTMSANSPRSIRVPAAAAPILITSLPNVTPLSDSFLQVPMPALISFSIRSYALPSESKPSLPFSTAPVNAFVGEFIRSKRLPTLASGAPVDPLLVILFNASAMSFASSLSSAIIVSRGNLRI